MKLFSLAVSLLAFFVSATAEAVIFVGGAGGTGIQRFDEKTGAWLGPLISNRQHGYNGTSGMVIGPDQYLYVAGSDVTGSANIWRFNLAENRFVGVFASLDGPGDFFDDVTFGPDGNLYVTDPNHGTVTSFDGKTGQWRGDFISGLEGAEDLEFAPNGELFVTAGPTGMWRFDGTTGAVLGRVKDGVNDFLTFGPDSLLYQTAWGSVTRLHPQTGELDSSWVADRGFLDGNRNYNSAVAFAPDGYLYTTDVFHNEVLRFDAVTGSFVDVVVPRGLGGLEQPLAIVYSPIPEPATFVIAIAGMVLGGLIAFCRRPIAVTQDSPLRREECTAAQPRS
jgi:WD40 repeat protein